MNLVFAVLLLSVAPHPVEAYVPPVHSVQYTYFPETPIRKIPTVEEVIREEFKKIPIMIAIARCESTFRQFNERGGVLRGVENSNDLGVFQVNTTHHGKEAERLGFDLETLEGNIEYSKVLYEREGTVPWNNSKHCWNA